MDLHRTNSISNTNEEKQKQKTKKPQKIMLILSNSTMSAYLTGPSNPLEVTEYQPERGTHIMRRYVTLFLNFRNASYSLGL